MKNNDSTAGKAITNILTVTAFVLLLGFTFLYARGTTADDTAAPGSSAPVTGSDLSGTSSSPEIPAIESITITAATEYLTAGSTMDLQTEMYPSDADLTDLIWSSSDDSVATVDQNGKLTAISKGQARIYVRTDTGINSSFTINVIERVLVYLSPSKETGQEYPVGNTNESAQSKLIAGYCKDKLTLAGLDVLICEDEELTTNGRARDAKKNNADLYVAIHTSGTSDEGARVAFIRNMSDSSRMSLYIKDRLAAIVETEEKGTVISGLNFDIKELEYTSEQRIPAVFVEAQSHKKAENAQWIIDNSQKIGCSIADGIMDFILNDVD